MIGALIVNTGLNPNNGFCDGAIINAISNRRCLWVHAQHICNLNKTGYAKYGRRPIYSLAYMWWDAVSQYRFMRVHRDWVIRHEIATGKWEIFGKRPTIDKKQAIEVDLFIRNRLRHKNHRIFGEPGREVWHGGKTDNSLQGTMKVWDFIEKMTKYRRENFNWWPFGSMDKVSHLCLNVDQLDDQMANVFVAQKYEKPMVLVPWRTLPRMNYSRRQKVLSPSWSVDLTHYIYNLNETVINSNLLKVELVGNIKE